MKRSYSVHKEKYIWDLFLQLANAIAFLYYGYDRKARHPDEAPRNWQMTVYVFSVLSLPALYGTLNLETRYKKYILGMFL